MKKVLFVNLDGTLVVTESGRPYPLHSKDWKFINETLFAIKFYLKKGYKLVIVSNQDGVAKGFVSEEVIVGKLETICKKIEEGFQLEENSVVYAYCIDGEGFKHSPNPGMVYEILVDEELGLKNSIMMGSIPDDFLFASNVGVSQYMDIAYILAEDWKHNIQQLNASSL